MRITKEEQIQNLKALYWKKKGQIRSLSWMKLSISTALDKDYKELETLTSELRTYGLSPEKWVLNEQMSD